VFSSGRWIGYAQILAGLIVIGFAIAGFTFERQTIVDGVAYPPSRWGERVQWPPLVLGTALLGIGFYTARHRDAWKR
jgi:hypothetical protein